MMYLVVGHPRSGTSAVCGALEAGGLPVIRSPLRDQRFNQPDGEYRPNPGSLYEPDIRQCWEVGWPYRFYRKNAVMKCLTRWLRHVCVHEYKVIFLLRHPEEIRQSYEAAHNVRRRVEQIQAEVDEALAALRNRRDVLELHVVHYRDVLLARPLEVFSSLKWPINAEAASRYIDSKQCRFKHEELTAGL